MVYKSIFRVFFVSMMVASSTSLFSANSKQTGRVSQPVTVQQNATVKAGARPIDDLLSSLGISLGINGYTYTAQTNLTNVPYAKSSELNTLQNTFAQTQEALAVMKTSQAAEKSELLNNIAEAAKAALIALATAVPQNPDAIAAVIAIYNQVKSLAAAPAAAPAAA